jgi:hypothetical protein
MPTAANNTPTDTVQRCRQPSSARGNDASPSQGDFCLFDERGRQLGAIKGARTKPLLGPNARTLLIIPTRAC